MFYNVVKRVKYWPDIWSAWGYETFHFLSRRTSDENINSKRLKKAEVWKNNHEPFFITLKWKIS